MSAAATLTKESPEVQREVIADINYGTKPVKAIKVRALPKSAFKKAAAIAGIKNPIARAWASATRKQQREFAPEYRTDFLSVVDQRTPRQSDE